jgi:hypothetical protein
VSLGKGKPGRRQVAEAVAAAVDRVPNVARSGALNMGTLIPGGRVDGVSLGETVVTVHVIVTIEFGLSLEPAGLAVGEAAQAALAAMGDARLVSTIIEDLAQSATFEKAHSDASR